MTSSSALQLKEKGKAVIETYGSGQSSQEMEVSIFSTLALDISPLNVEIPVSQSEFNIEIPVSQSQP